jgi:hypothetical protein
LLNRYPLATARKPSFSITLRKISSLPSMRSTSRPSSSFSNSSLKSSSIELACAA